jgi:hypothetical protein
MEWHKYSQSLYYPSPFSQQMCQICESLLELDFLKEYSLIFWYIELSLDIII